MDDLLKESVLARVSIDWTDFSSTGVRGSNWPFTQVKYSDMNNQTALQEVKRHFYSWI